MPDPKANTSKATAAQQKPASPTEQTKTKKQELILYFIYGSLSICVLLIAAIAAKWGWADLQANSARSYMNKWEKQRQINDQDEWNKAFTRMATAYNLHPGNAEYAADIGRLYEWRALQHPGWHRDAKKYRTKAIKYFKKAVEIRPTWGFIWAHYAQSKVLNQQFDQDTIEALEKAMVLNPWEIKVQQKVIWLGLNLWDKLTENTRDMLKSEINRSLELQPKETLQLAIRTNKENIVKPLLNEQQTELLEKLLKRP